ncbi:hypothetical protein D5086_012429 [Populus alba]|uniref:Uncharacterized protein n=1 Tax=Populus alba TaxID=43335 RepID=A0ACC4C2X7_POPAL
MLSLDYVKKSVQRGMDNYHAKYIETSSVDPVYHVCFGGMVLSYFLALPEERRHLEHQQHSKEHGFGEPSGSCFADHLFAWYFLVVLGAGGRKILSCQWLAA